MPSPTPPLVRTPWKARPAFARVVSWFVRA